MIQWYISSVVFPKTKQKKTNKKTLYKNKQLAAQ